MIETMSPAVAAPVSVPSSRPREMPTPPRTMPISASTGAVKERNTPG
ncbi:MAG: hypothetical protein M5U28_33165 [Sandaracinaceae bacterium]|nr:hypothetical protein [Sandaracinaceae bacterium]